MASKRPAIELYLSEGKKAFFCSDQHLGAPNRDESLSREKKLVQWLDEISKDAEYIFLLGDLFDFWFEYKKVVPKGFIRVLGKLAELADNGVHIYFFVGNHDLWMKGYLKEEVGIEEIFFDTQHFNINGKKFMLGHGDGKGPGDIGYKRMKKLFRNPFAQWIYRWLHPDIGVHLAQYLSVKNKLISGKEDVKFLGEDKEWLVQYCKRKLSTEHYDYLIFGHRHLPLKIPIQSSLYINLGDWITHYTYGVFDGERFELKNYSL